jgi:endonuclease I
MRKYNLISVFVLCAFFAQAQLTLSSPSIDFGDVLTTEEKEIAVDVTNENTYPVKVDQTKLYSDDFSCRVTNTEIGVGATSKIRVTFKPRHNIAYNSELIVVLDDGAEYRIDIQGEGRYEEAYYSSTFNKSYQDLKDELKTILARNYRNLGYTNARDNMYGDIDNQNGNVTCVYTGRVSTFSTRSGANSNNMNCEHTWPQSFGSSSEPQRADIHHLFPTDGGTNSRRGNNPFGLVTNPSWTGGGSKLGSGLFEPRDEHKGAAARAMLYFAIRYQNYNNFINSQEDILKQWHVTFQPTAWDIQRNEKIFGYQKNRNPFVDHPEFIERMNKIGSNDPRPVIRNLEISQKQISYNYVTPSTNRTIYLVNNGNIEIPEISNVTSKNGNIIIKSIDATALPGDVSALLITFKSLPDGTYDDEITIDTDVQTGDVFKIPITFTIGQASVDDLIKKPLIAIYRAHNQTIHIDNLPTDVYGIEIWNSNGQMILNDISPTLNDIPFNNPNSGIYFVLVKTKAGAVASKVLVY